MNNEGTILLVEDDPNDADLTMRSFRKAGIRAAVVHVSDGDEALEYLFPRTGAPPPLPAMVVLDWKLPRMSGLEVLQRLRSERRTRLLPIVVLTSSFEDRDVASAYDNGANSYVRKPIEPGRFEEAARDLGMYWLLRNEVPRL